MKRLCLFLLIAALLFACGCSSDKPTGGESSMQAQVSSEEGSKTPESSQTDPSSTTEETTTSSQPEESTAGISPTTDTRSDAESGKTTGTSSQGTAEEPKAPEQTRAPESTSGTTASQPVSSNPPVTPPSEEKPTAPEPEVSEQPEPVKSIYDYPFDIESIKAEMIQIGVEEMGWRHQTHYNDGTPVTPDNSSWSETVVANQNIQGERLKKQLYELMTLFTDEFRASYGGAPIREFTVYSEPLGNGAYVFYLLY